MKNKTDKLPKLNKKELDPHTFASTLGQAVWLMTMSKEHRELSIKQLEENALAAILLQQFKMYMKAKRPVAFLTWAAVSDDIKKRMDKGDKTLELTDWRSGNNIVIIDCVSPFNPPKIFEEEFIKKLKKAPS